MADVTLEDVAKQSGLTRAVLYKYVKACKDVLGELRRGEDNRILLTGEQAELLLKIRGMNRLEGVPLAQVKERLQAGEASDLEVTRTGPSSEVSILLSGLAASLNQIESRLGQQATAIEKLSRRQDEADALRRENEELRRKVAAARGISQVSATRAEPKAISLPWYRRWWCELVAPEMFRVNAERGLASA